MNEDDLKKVEELTKKTDEVLNGTSERIENIIMAFSLCVIIRSKDKKCDLESLYKMKFKSEILMQSLDRAKEILDKELQDLTKIITEVTAAK